MPSFLKFFPRMIYIYIYIYIYICLISLSLLHFGFVVILQINVKHCLYNRPDTMGLLVLFNRPWNMCLRTRRNPSIYISIYLSIYLSIFLSIFRSIQPTLSSSHKNNSFHLDHVIAYWKLNFPMNPHVRLLVCPLGWLSFWTVCWSGGLS